MLGDRASDVRGAAHHGMDCVGAVWGFGTQQELAEAGAKYLCREPKELAHLIF
jgi:phosphoglycolate phosphatase